MKTKTTSPTNDIKPRAKSAKQLATVLSKWLQNVDKQQFVALNKNDDRTYDMLEKERKDVIKAAVKNGLKLISIQVADGEALYYEIKRTKTQITFEWLNTGGDLYISEFGKTVSVPLITGQRLTKKFNPNL